MKEYTLAIIQLVIYNSTCIQVQKTFSGKDTSELKWESNPHSHISAWCVYSKSKLITITDLHYNIDRVDNVWSKKKKDSVDIIL